jgi:hypothetical protein
MEKLIVVTFAGRKKYMEILFKYIEKYKDYINEYHLYLATENQTDIQYMLEFQDKHKDFVKIVKMEDYSNFNKALVWNLAYKNCQDENTIYLKIDDDVVYIDENLFTKFIDFRKSSNAPLVYPHIINNIISTPNLQKMGRLNLESKWDFNNMIVNTWSNTINRIKNNIKILKGNLPKDYVVTNLLSEFEILCPTAWRNINYSRESHIAFLNILKSNNVNNLYTDNITLSNYEPMSIQCCAWFGRDLKDWVSKFGIVGEEDEPWLAVYLPCWLDNPNVIYGGSIVSHFSSYIQEEYLISLNILNEYYKIIE